MNKNQAGRQSLVRWLGHTTTSRFIGFAMALAVAALLCDSLDRLTWQNHRRISGVFDTAAMILFWSAYGLNWVLLVIAPFRPDTEFSWRGSYGRRARTFSFALGALLFTILTVVLAYALA
jgi:hypothetical protein